MVAPARVVSSRVSDIVDAQNRAVGRVASYVADRIVRRLIDTTPVDTHFAQSSWIVTIGEKTSAVGGSKKSVSTDAQDAGLLALEIYEVSQGQIFIQNNSAYIMVLNAGSSQQAPAGFIEAAIESGAMDANDLNL